MTFFTADAHFGHKNIIRLCDRPFSSIDDMDEALISAWNERVSGDDTVYIIGDLFFRCDDPAAILRRLKGRKRLLLGNHDETWTNKVDLRKYFISVDAFLEISDGERGLTLCHYPLLTWKHARRSYMIHGHIHNDTSADFWPLLRKRENVLNAGVDINGLRPVTFEELLENNRQWKNAHV